MIARDKSKMVSKFMKVNKNMDTLNQDVDSLSSPMEQPFNAEEKYTEDIFPCFLVMIGSNGAMFYVSYKNDVIVSIYVSSLNSYQPKGKGSCRILKCLMLFLKL